MSDLGFCVHGHFYQPSREDPITGQIPEEKGAYPFNNWNELIFSHCYFPNTELGNFKKISFNFGPTLINWMDKHHPAILQDIISQDQYNFDMYGVGNAIAQPYHHTILPLASKEDKVTQIHWGIEDFKFRFGHNPNGMWLPETAVDMETLELLADFGIGFTILAPWQAVSEHLDITQPYWVELSKGKKIAAFFYHRDLSTQISFNPLTTINADIFANNFILPNLNHHKNDKKPRYLLLASDGELYGHHQPFRDKFLAHLLNGTLKNVNIRQIFPALWLKENPPTEFIKIHEMTSWSCHHGVNRWSSGCNCTQDSEWKKALRDFINCVGDIVNDVYLSYLSDKISDVWELRHRYVDVLLNKITENELLDQLLPINRDSDTDSNIITLLRAQYERQRMYTSCGWFFEDFDRIEPQNIIAYATQALILTSQINGVDYFPKIESKLERIVSSTSGVSGLDMYNQYLKRSKTESQKVLISQ